MHKMKPSIHASVMFKNSFREAGAKRFKFKKEKKLILKMKVCDSQTFSQNVLLSFESLLTTTELFANKNHAVKISTRHVVCQVIL